MSNPYARPPPTAFWRTAIEEKSGLEIRDLWNPKHPFERSHKVATFGSCFAQHLRCALKERGYTWLDAEPWADIFVPAIQKKYNYGIFSARTGCIYTVAALRQWVSWALSLSTPPEEIWEAKGRFFDPFRPSIEPGGFATPEELLASRDLVLRAIRNVVENADWFVFTLGATEAWVTSSGGRNYDMGPGTIAGEFYSSNHSFKNYTFAEISSDLGWVIETISNLNNKVRFLLTVSTVPLNETAAGKHVLTAKQSLLRTVAGTAADNLELVDYFPSYEIITAPALQGMFYEANPQSVSNLGLTFVVDAFFARLKQVFGDMPAVIESAITADRNPREFWSNVLTARTALRDVI